MIEIQPWKKALIALALSISSLSAQAAFNAAMTPAQVQTEISSMLAQTNPKTGKNYSLVEVADAAKAAGIQSNAFAAAVIAAGANPAIAVTAAIAAWGQADAPAIVTAALTAAPAAAGDVVRVANALAPELSQAIQTAALAAPGVDPTAVTQATAAGPAAPATVAALTAAAAAPGGGAGGGGGGGIASPA